MGFKTSGQGENTSNRNLNNRIMLTATKAEIVKKKKQSPSMNIFLVMYFIDDIMRITHAKFQAKILHIMGSRAL